MPKPFEDEAWLLRGAAKDRQTITATWDPHAQNLIEGVAIHEVRHVPKSGGHLTEILRSEWLVSNPVVDQVFQSVFQPGTLSAWHAHARTTDRLFVSYGTVRIVLYDARGDSPTFGRLNDFLIGTVRPALIVVPPRVWHGVQALGTGPSILLNLVDAAYDYADPDHWRIPHNSEQIPFSFAPNL